jgi:cold shock CspA family protein
MQHDVQQRARAECASMRLRRVYWQLAMSKSEKMNSQLSRLSSSPSNSPAAKTTASATAAMDRLIAAGFSNGQPFSASVTWNSSEVAVEFKVVGSQQPRPAVNRPMIAAAPHSEPPTVPHAHRQPPSAPQQAMNVPKPYARPPPSAPVTMPVQPAPSPIPRPVAHPPSHPAATMITLSSRVKWYDSAKGFGVTVPNEPGHPEVFITDADLKAGGIAELRRGMAVTVTFDASRPKPRALVVQLP